MIIKIKRIHIEQLNYTGNVTLFYEAVGLVDLNSFWGFFLYPG